MHTYTTTIPFFFLGFFEREREREREREWEGVMKNEILLNSPPKKKKLKRPSRVLLFVYPCADTVAQLFQALSENFELHVYCEIMGCTASFTDSNLWSAFNRLRGEPFVSVCHVRF